MLKRLNIYFKEMYPLIPRAFLGLILFSEIYFIILLNNGVTSFNFGVQELIGSFTIFTFLMWLRIADDFKDYELDCRLFAHRPLPSGRVTKKDLKTVLMVMLPLTAILNILFMNNVIFFVFLFTYGYLMSMWFFKKHKIQNSLPMALVTHNPVQIILNIYVITFTCFKYNLSLISPITILACLTLYFPALIWEISRKIRAPKDETEYVTYSKLFGYKKATKFVLILTLVDILTNVLLVAKLSYISIIALLLNATVMTVRFVKFIKNPEIYEKLVTKVERYTYIQEIIMLLTIAAYIGF